MIIYAAGPGAPCTSHSTSGQHELAERLLPYMALRSAETRVYIAGRVASPSAHRHAADSVHLPAHLPTHLTSHLTVSFCGSVVRAKKVAFA